MTNVDIPCSKSLCCDTTHVHALWGFRPLLGTEPESESLETTEFPDDYEEDGDIVSDDDAMLDAIVSDDHDMLSEEENDN